MTAKGYAVIGTDRTCIGCYARLDLRDHSDQYRIGRCTYAMAYGQVVPGAGRRACPGVLGRRIIQATCWGPAIVDVGRVGYRAGSRVVVTAIQTRRQLIGTTVCASPASAIGVGRTLTSAESAALPHPQLLSAVT